MLTKSLTPFEDAHWALLAQLRAGGGNAEIELAKPPGGERGEVHGSRRGVKRADPSSERPTSTGLCSTV